MRRRAMLGLVTAPAWLSCQPAGPPEERDDCALERPAPGEVVVAQLDCDERVPPGGEGRADSDLYLATSELRAVFRHPQDALTVPGVAGGTVVDVAPWEGPDIVHEVVPLIGGAWLDHVDATVLPDGLRLDGEGGSVTWRAEGPWLVAEGADGLRIDPAGDVEVLDGLVLGSTTVVGAVGEIEDDGVLVVSGTDRLLVATDTTAWPALAEPDGRRISGATDGERLTLLAGGRPVGRVPVDGAFDLLVPARVDGVRADAVGSSPSPVVPPAEGLDLRIGGRGVVTLRAAHRLLATYTDADGRDVVVYADPEEPADLPLGAGDHAVRLAAGPGYVPEIVQVQGDQELSVALEPALDRGSWVLASFARPADRSPEWRGSDTTAVRLAAGDGLAYATFAPLANVSDASGAEWGRPDLIVTDGSSLAGDGWRVAAWPFRSSDRKALHGAVVLTGLGPEDAAAAIRGGSDRPLLVDLGWLAAVGPPHVVGLDPELVALTGGDPATLRPWLDRLDAGRALIPTGPYTWVPVADPALVGEADVAQPLYRGLVSAGSGPILELAVDGLAPGEVLPEDSGTVHTVVVTIRGEVPANLALVTTAGEIPVSPGRNLVELDGTWVIAAAWGGPAREGGDGSWAVTGPVWLRAPSRPPPSPPPR